METFASNDNKASFNPLAGMEHDRDWHTYQDASREISVKSGHDTKALLAQKQACALAYLGKRAQNEGGVYSKTRVRILTPEFVHTMAKTNTAKRHLRYPWLERLLALLEEIDQVQDQISLKGKVLSIVTLKHNAPIQLPRNS